MLAAFAAAVFSTNSCLVRINKKAIENNMIMADGELVTRTVSIDGEVREYRLVGSGDFTFIQSDGAPCLEITTSENIMPYLKTDVTDGVLTCIFHSDSTFQFHSGQVRVVLKAADLEGLQVVGSGDAVIEGLKRDGDFSVAIAGSGDVRIDSLSCDNLHVVVAGSGDAKIGVTAKNGIDASIAGSGDVRLTGSADRASFSVTGSGDIFANGLKVKGDVSTSVKGSGDIRL